MKVGKTVFLLWLKRGVRDCGFRRGRERGAALVEFAGMAIVVAVIIGGVIAVAPSHGRDISCSILSKISEAIGAGEMQCGGTDNKAEEDKHKPTDPCTTHQHSQNFNAGLGVVADVEVNEGIVTEKLSNGHYRVTDKRGDKVGVSAGYGGGVEFTVDNQTYGSRASAEAAAKLAEERGVTYEVDSEQAKDGLKNYLLRKKVVDRSTGIFGGWVNGMIDGATHYEPPKPKEIYYQVGAEGSAEAAATEGITGAKAEIGAAVAIGGKVNLEKGTVTTYYKVNAQASGRAGAAGAGGEGEASGEIVVAVTADNNDPDKVLNVSVTGSYDAQIGATTPLGVDNPAPLESGQVWTASVDLSSKEVSQMTRNFLAAAKVSGFNSGKDSFQELNQATATFVNAAVDRGVLTRQDVSKRSSKYGARATFEYEAVASAGLGYVDETIEFSNGQYYSGGKWNRWEGC